MKTFFDPAAQAEILQRVNAVRKTDAARWGKMNAFQMVKHGRLWTEMLLGILPCKRMFIGRIFGTMGLKRILKDESPMGKNAPTAFELKVTEHEGDFDSERALYITRLKELGNSTFQQCIHPFFGTMTREQIGYFTYKHIDHHLRQFGV